MPAPSPPMTVACSYVLTRASGAMFVEDRVRCHHGGREYRRFPELPSMRPRARADKKRVPSLRHGAVPQLREPSEDCRGHGSSSWARECLGAHGTCFMFIELPNLYVASVYEDDLSFDAQVYVQCPSCGFEERASPLHLTMVSPDRLLLSPCPHASRLRARSSAIASDDAQLSRLWDEGTRHGRSLGAGSLPSVHVDPPRGIRYRDRSPSSAGLRRARRAVEAVPRKAGEQGASVGY